MKSTFNRDTQGWTMSGDVSSFTWSAGSGNPGGALAWTDAAAGDVAYYLAPAAYEGRKTGYYGGILSYDIKDSAGPNFDSPDVRITGANGVTLIATVGTPGTDWTHFSIALDTSGGWHTSDGAVATRADIRGVLKDVTAFEIRAEFVSGGENGGLDNVVLVKPVAAAAFGADTIEHDAFAVSDHAPLADHGHIALV